MIVTPTPQPDNILTSLAQLLTPPPPLTTPLPYNAVVATPTPEPMIVTNTPTPLNAATSVAYSQYATAVAILTGTFTPTPSYIVTATPVPVLLQRLPLIQYLDLLPPTPTAAVPTPPPSRMPAELIGRILFLSNREGGEGVYMVDPATGRLARINERWPYDLAKEAEQKSPDGQLVSIVREDNRRIPQIYVYSAQYNSYRQITTTSGWSYDPAWSPTGEWIAFVSQETGNDEIFIIRPDGSETRQLTKNTWEWDKHVSWSPDGQEIVFWSNRDTGRAQLWVMNSDGSNQRKLLDSPYEDREPVWVK
jgi:TolB protein